jgi:2-phosphosulfolactate phosphatase
MPSPTNLPVDVCFLPRDLQPRHRAGRAVVVFDVLRATTSITAALKAGVRSIRIFPTTADANAARDQYPSALLCGEEQCLPPPGFDLGNSPAAFEPSLHTGRDILMSTTNGTRAILSAAGAAHICVGGLVNAAAVAKFLAQKNLPVALLCAGTNGAIAMEDILGAGAIIASLKLLGTVRYESDSVHVADQLFSAAQNNLASILRLTRGGLNLIAAGLEADIDFAARLNTIETVGVVSADSPPIIARHAAPEL